MAYCLDDSRCRLNSCLRDIELWYRHVLIILHGIIVGSPLFDITLPNFIKQLYIKGSISRELTLFSCSAVHLHMENYISWGRTLNFPSAQHH